MITNCNSTYNVLLFTRNVYTSRMHANTHKIMFAIEFIV